MLKPWIKSISMELLGGLFVLSSFFFAQTAILKAEDEQKDNKQSDSYTNDEDRPTYKDYEEAKYGKVKLGLKGGLNVSTLYNAGSTVTDDHARIGFHFGGYAQAPITKFIAIQPELLFSLNGDRTDYKFGDGTVTPGNGSVETNLYYLVVPVMGVLNITDNISLQAGPYASYLLGADIKNSSDNTAFNKYTELNRNDFNTIDYGVAGAVDFDINKMWDVGFRYSHGLRNIGKSGLSGDLMQNSRNATFQVYMGVYF